ncbi:preprotein translocase subunit YajC [Xylanimonas oleitrophica]|nr:preprotein translocase subunit YajC [Xylanimonas oleitrophica]
MIILIVVLLGLMFFMSSRTRKQQREAQQFRAELAPGQEVMTGSGMFGTVVEVDEESDVVTIESAGSRTRWLRAAIAKRVDTPADEPAEADVTEQSGSTGTISPAGSAPAVDVPDDLSGLDSAQREYREQQRKAEGDSGK